jgi:hypothetical protein
MRLPIPDSGEPILESRTVVGVSFVTVRLHAKPDTWIMTPGYERFDPFLHRGLSSDADSGNWYHYGLYRVAAVSDCAGKARVERYDRRVKDF